jgi:uncharacterized protein DUF2867
VYRPPVDHTRRMKVQEVAPEVDRDAVLAGSQFIDAYRVAIAGTDLDARTAAERMFAHSPRWIDALLRLRNIAVAPFGLKTSGAGERNFGGMVGLFPVLSEAPEHMVRALTIITSISASL